MTIHERFDATQRWLVVAVLVGGAVVFLPWAMDASQLPKATVAALGAVLLAGAALARAAFTAQVRPPRGPGVYAALVFAGAVVIVTLASPVWAVSLPGTYQRWGGAIPYLAYVAIFLAVVTAFDAEHLDRLALAGLTAAGLVAVYGLLQMVGADPVPWAGAYGNRPISTMGNPNFSSGFLGSVVPLALWAAVSRRPAAVRVTGAGIAALAVVVVAATGSNQGLAAAAAGTVTLGLVLAAERGYRTTVVRLAAVGLPAAAVTAGVLLATLGPEVGPRVQAAIGFRQYYWDAARSMFASDPIAGVGLDLYGDFYHGHQALAAAADPAATTDAAHSVPLGFFAGGGLILGLAYLAFVAVVGWSLVRAVRDRDGADLRLTGGLGGAWVAYHTQALVSIDVPALGLLHWVLAGALVVLGATARVEPVELPFAPLARRARHRRGSRAPARVLVAVAAVTVLAAVVYLSRPVRADVAAAVGIALRGDDPQVSARVLDRAVELAGWQDDYWLEFGDSLWRAGRADEAMTAFATALDRNPRNLAAAVTGARAAAEVGDAGRAQQWWDQAVALAPTTPEVLVGAATFAANVSEFDRARALLDEALAVDPGNAAAAELLAQIDETTGD